MSPSILRRLPDLYVARVIVLDHEGRDALNVPVESWISDGHSIVVRYGVDARDRGGVLRRVVEAEVRPPFPFPVATPGTVDQERENLRRAGFRAGENDPAP